MENINKFDGGKDRREFFMKRKSFSLFFVLSGLIFLNYGCSSFMPVSRTSNTQMVENLIGVWEGSFVATQGETGLTLTVTKENGVLEALFKFYNLPGRTNAADGSYYMNITYQNGRYTFKGYEWIEHPNNYVFLNLEGTVDSTGDTLNGMTMPSPNGGSPYPFTLVRKE
jgi:hypothetical protein